MKKRCIGILLTMALLVTGCGGTSSTSTETVESATQTADNSMTETESAPTLESTASSAGNMENDAWYFADDLWEEEKQDTPLSLFGENIILPLTWDALEKYIDEVSVKGHQPYNTSLVEISKEEMKDSTYLPSGQPAYLKIMGSKYDIEYVIAENESSMTIGEYLTNGRFFISGHDGGVMTFFDIDESLKPENDSDYDDYWLLQAIFDKYGCPDYIGDNPYCTAFYWARDGYYFGLQAQHLEGINTTLSFQTLLPAVAWDYFCEWMGQESVGLPLVPYGEVKYTNDGKTAPPVAGDALTAYEDAIDRTLAESVGLVETSELLGSTGTKVPIVTAEGGSLFSADRGMLGDWIHGVRRKVGEDEIAIYHHYIRSGDLAELTQTLSLYVSVSSSTTKAVYDDLQKPAHTLIVVDDDPMRDGDEKYFSAYRILAIDDTLSVITEVGYHRYRDIGSEEEKAVFDTYKTICGVYGIGTDVLTQYAA